MPQGPGRLVWRNHRNVSKLELLQGTLDLMVLQTLHTLGPLHGYGIACSMRRAMP